MSEPDELTPKQRNVLNAIRDIIAETGQFTTPHRVGKRLGFDNACMSRVLEFSRSLQRKGFVILSGRAPHTIILTPKGEKS